MKKKTYDTLLFLEIILSEGVIKLHTYRYDDEIVSIYHGPSGKAVHICETDEEITNTIAKQYLVQLGLTDLIDRLF